MSHEHESPFSVEELPAAKWEELEDAVFAELEAGPSAKTSKQSRGWAFAGVVVLSAVLSAAAALAVLSVGTGPNVEDPPARTSSTRFDGGPEGAELTLDDVHLVLGANAQGLALGDSERGWVVALEEGCVEFAVAPRQARPSFVVQAANVHVEVVGTRFVVTRDDERVDVAVVEGVVRVITAGHSTTLRAGESWTTHEPAAASAAPSTPAAAPGTPATTPATPATLPAAAPPALPAAARAAPRLSDAELYERAAAQEAQNPAVATNLYRRLARGGGAWAEAALFARGRLELETGNVVSGKRALRRYLQRYPHGVNAQDARLLLSQQ